MNRAQRRTKGNGATVTVDALLTIYKDQQGNMRCNLKPGLTIYDARSLLNTFKDVYSDLITDAKIKGPEDKPEPSRILKPY